MLFVLIFGSIALAIAAIVFGYMIVKRNRDLLYGGTPIGWWIIAILVSQFYLVMIPFMWWPDWFLGHQWILITSVCASMFATILAGIIKLIIR